MNNAQMKQWVSDLQSGMYVNCVYCGYRYGPHTEDVPREVLAQHIKVCAEHPVYHLILAARSVLKRFGGCSSFRPGVHMGKTCADYRTYLLENQGLNAKGTRFDDLCDGCFVQVVYAGLL